MLVRWVVSPGRPARVSQRFTIIVPFILSINKGQFDMVINSENVSMDLRPSRLPTELILDAQMVLPLITVNWIRTTIGPQFSFIFFS